MKLCLNEGEKWHQNAEIIISIPSPSAGDIGLMATDCLLATLPFQRIGYIESIYLKPMVGYTETYHDDVGPIECKPLEIYQLKLKQQTQEEGDNVQNNLYILHQRTAVKEGKAKDFVLEYKEFLHSIGFKFVLFLSSESMDFIPDEFVHGNRIFASFSRDILSSTSNTSIFSSLILLCEKFYQPVLLPSMYNGQQGTLEDYEEEEPYHQEYYGILFFIRNLILAPNPQNAFLLGKFSPEYANDVDGKLVASLVLTGLGHDKIDIKTPKSWQQLFADQVRKSSTSRAEYIH